MCAQSLCGVFYNSHAGRVEGTRLIRCAVCVMEHGIRANERPMFQSKVVCLCIHSDEKHRDEIHISASLVFGTICRPYKGSCNSVSCFVLSANSVFPGVKKVRTVWERVLSVCVSVLWKM